jgi:hypothetical protein
VVVVVVAVVVVAAYEYYHQDDTKSSQPGQQSQPTQSASSNEPNQSIKAPAPEDKAPMTEPEQNYTPMTEPNTSEPLYTPAPDSSNDDEEIVDQPTEGTMEVAGKKKKIDPNAERKHHILPQRFNKDKYGNFFKNLGIDIHSKEFIRILPQWAHQMLHDAKLFDYIWDLQVEHWQELIRNGIKVTKEEVIRWARDLEAQFEKQIEAQTGKKVGGKDSKEDYVPKIKTDKK